MTRLRMIVSMSCMVPAWALLGGFARLDAPGPGGVVRGMIVGGAIGVCFGLVFGGAKGQWLDYIFGPELPEEGINEAELDARRSRTEEMAGRKPEREE